VSRVDRKVHADPVAVTCSGDVLVNAGYFDDVDRLEDMLEVAKKEKGSVFIGFVVGRDLALISDRVHDACKEGAAFVVGRRQKRRSARRARRPR
jgi:hypothetical protein